MNNQTRALFEVIPPNIPAFIQPLINSYRPDPASLNTQLDFTLYPEPYYGDYNECSIVLLTHPGRSTQYWKGIGSRFNSFSWQRLTL